MSNLACETGLANTTNPNERDEPVDVEELAHFSHLTTSPHEGRHERRQVGRRAQVENRILNEDAIFELSGACRGFYSEFLDERVAKAPTCTKGFCLPIAAVQRQHERPMEPFPQRMLHSQRLEFGQHPLVIPEGKFGLHQEFGGLGPLLIEFDCPQRKQRGVIREMIERPTAPEQRAIAQQSCNSYRVCGEQRTSLFEGAAELQRVDGVTIQSDPVALSVRNDSITEGLAEIRHVRPNDVRSSAGGRLAPYLVDQTIDADRIRCGGQEHGKDALLPGSAEVDLGIAVNGPQRAKYLEPHMTIAFRCILPNRTRCSIASLGSFLDRRRG